MNDLLSICIPTFNRAAFLKANLENLIPQVEKYDIPIYISDNASGDDTAKVVEELRSNYPHIFYNCNDMNYGPDYNITKVLRASTTSYAWFLGDDDTITADGIDRVMQIIQNGHYDLIVVNAGEDKAKRVPNIKSVVYTDRNRLLGDLGWHMTCMSCLILHSDVIRNGRFEKYIGTFLVHIGAMFDYLADKEFAVFWCDKSLVSVIDGNVASWTEKTFDIWIDNWSEIINSLPSSYTEQAKQKCIKDHGIKSEVFSLKNFLSLKVSNIYNYKIYKKYCNKFKYITDVPLSALLLVSLMPLGITRIGYSLWKAYKKVRVSYGFAGQPGKD